MEFFINKTIMKFVFLILIIFSFPEKILSQKIGEKVAKLEALQENNKEKISNLSNQIDKLNAQLIEQNKIISKNKETIDKQKLSIEESNKNSQKKTLWPGIVSGVLTAIVGWLLAIYGFMKPLVNAQFKTALEKLTEENEAKARQLIMMAQKQIDWSKAKILIAGENEDVIKELEPTEIKQFRHKQSDITSTIDINSFDPDKNKFDVIIYRFVPNAAKEDPALVKFVDDISDKYPNIPLVVYTRGDQINFIGPTIKKLKSRGLYTIANNPITLVTNTADAYKVSKL